MTTPLHRAILLYQHSRYADAEQELRRHLLEHPNDAMAHSLLGLSLLKQEKVPEAQAEVDQAVALAPDEAEPHYCRGLVLQERNRFEEAEAAAREAARLDPGDARYRGGVAATLFAQRKWQPALDAALAGLALNPEDAACEHYRTAALTNLGRHDEALRSVDAALAREPDNSLTHANKGWALLHQRQPKPALEHFRESLRLDPTNDYARAGMIESLKARHFIYRWMLAYFLSMSRLSDRARWGVIFGGVFWFRALTTMARDPAAAPYILPMQIAYIVFVLLTWFAVPLFNLLLRLNRFGRHALSRDQRVASNWFAACALALAVCLSLGIAYDSEPLLVAAIVAGGVSLPLITVYNCDHGWPRQSMSLFAAAMLALGLLATIGAILQQDWTHVLLTLFGFGFLLTPWVANYLMTAIVRR